MRKESNQFMTWHLIATIVFAVMFAFAAPNTVNAQCNAVTGGSGNGQTISSLPSCGSYSGTVGVPSSGYAQFTNLESGGVYIVSKTSGGTSDNYVTVRTATSGGTVYTNGTLPRTFQSFVGTVYAVVTPGTGSSCTGSFTGNPTSMPGGSAILRYQRVSPPTPGTAVATYNCNSTTSLTASDNTSYTVNYQWQGSNNGTSWSNAAGSCTTCNTMTISSTTNPQYRYYRLRTGYGSCYAFGGSLEVVPRGNYTGNITVASNVTMAGTYIINGDFTVNSGADITEADGCELYIEANNVNIAGDIYGNGAGSSGGSGGSAGTGSSNLGCDVNNDAYAAGGNRGGGASGSGSGSQASSNGSNGIGCGQDCKSFDDYAGLVRGGGGAGGGGGGAYGGSGMSGGSGGTAGWYSTSGGPLLNQNYIDVCTDNFGAGGGSSGGSGGSAYGNSTNTTIDFGSGGAGAGGGGRGASTGGSGGSGGRGGGKITIISRDNPSAPYTFTLTGRIYVNGDNGSGGGGGGNAGRTASNCCSDLCNQDNTEEATNVSGGGGGGGAGGGSGGGIMLIAHGNVNISGTLEARGGSGGSGGGGGNSASSSYGGGGLCGGSNTINVNSGGAGSDGGKGGGGRIKIFYNDCAATTNVSPSYSVSAGSSGNGSGSSGSYYVGVHPDHDPLVAGTVSSDQVICEGQTPGQLINNSLASGGTGIYSYQWMRCTSGCGSPPTNYTTISGATGTAYSSGSLTTTTYFVRRVISGSCTEYTNPIIITVNEPSTVEAGSPITVCQSSSPSGITLSGASVGGGATQGSWSIVAGGGSLSNTSLTSNPAGVTYTPASNFSGTVTLQLTSNAAAGCYSVNDIRYIYVTALPTSSASNTGPYCTGETISLSTPAVTGATYSWSGPGGFTSSSRTPTRSSATTAMSGTYTVTVTANGCSRSSSTSVTVNQASTVNAGGPNTVCESPSPTAITLTGASIGGGATTGTWSIISGSGSLSNTGATTNPAGVTFTPAANFSGTVTLRLTSNALTSCSNVTDDRTINVTALPVSTASNTGSYCVGETISLSTPAVTGATYSWSGPGGFTSSSRTPTRSSATTAMAGSYSVTVTANGCSRASSTTVVVYTNPTVSVSPSSSTICSGGNVTLTANPVAGSGSGTFTYAWSGGGSSSTKSVSAAGTYTVTITEGVSGCTATGSATVSVVADPSISITTPSQTICKGNSVTLSSTIGNPGTGGCSRQWQSRPASGGTWSNMGTGATQNTGAITQNMQYQVIYSCGGSGCNTATSGTVTISYTDDNTWTGAAGSGGVGDWHTPGNWSCGLVPTVTTNVTIPGTGTAPNQPVIYNGNTGVCNTIDLNTGSNLTIQTNAELQVNP